MVALLPGQQRRLDKIKAMRESLSNELMELINEFGPQLWEDFNHVCFPYLVSFIATHSHMFESCEL